MRMIIIRAVQMRIVFISALACALLLGACGDEDEDDADLHVVATTGIVAEIARNIAGPGVEIEQLVPDGASPHDFQLSAKDRQKLAEADLVLANGANLEAGIPLDEAEGPVWELAANAGELLPFGDGGADPHVWMDPARVADAMPSLADAFAHVDAAGASGYRSRARDYAADLRTRDREFDDRLGRVPPGARKLVTSHDALGYFADRYGFEVVATAFPASGAEAEPSAGSLDDVVKAIEESGVPAVFAAAEDDPEVLRQLAAQAGVEVVDELLIESVGDSGGYQEMLSRDVDLIAGALAP